jgi:hypothetical protein
MYLNLFVSVFVQYFFFVYQHQRRKSLEFGYKGKSFHISRLFAVYPALWVQYNSWYVVNRSNLFLSRFTGCPEFRFYLSLKNKLLRHGRGERSLVIFTNFLFYLKIMYQLDPVAFVRQAFLGTSLLPFRLYTLKSSNRSYTFPGPILSEEEYQSLLIKNFGHSFRRRSEPGFLNKFFFELAYFIDRHSSSELLTLLQGIVQTGFENRAFLHYRWRIKR